MSKRTLLERAIDAERGNAGTDDADDETRRPSANVSSRSTTIDGEPVDLSEPRTSITFEDDNGLLSGEYGQPRPRKFWHAKQLGQTPPMELLKNAVSRQLIGGEPVATSDDEIRGAEADLADLVKDVYRGPHFQDKSLDNLLVDAVDDMIDTGWAYWELLPSANGEFPVAGFKPLPPLQMQHNVDEDSGELIDEPGYYQVPYSRTGGGIRMGGDATELERSQIVAMREPLATGSDTLYGESLATKVREWLELIIDVDVHQKRHYSDSQTPAGILDFPGDMDPDDLQQAEQDIVEAAGDPHELVTTSSGEGANWIPIGGSVVDLEAIQEQEWYYKLVFAAAGLNLNELGMIEGSGFAKETPALQRQVYKNVTKPFSNAIWQPQNAEVLPQMIEPLSVDAAPFRIGLERFDPVQEQIEREESLDEWRAGAPSLNELRGTLGKEATEYVIEIGGTEVDLADTPRYIVDKLVSMETPGLTVGEGSGDEQASTGPPDFPKTRFSH